MLNADPFTPRPTLTQPTQLAHVLERIGQGAATSADLWRRLTESFTVDLDAVATLLPRTEPEPVWLRARD